MPVLKIQTNVQYEEKQQLMKEATDLLSGLLSKPEKFIMVHLETNLHMMFGGNLSGLVYVELKSIGLPEDQTKQFSEALSAFLTEKFGVPASRIYIEFKDVKRHLFGWNGSTFES